MSNFAEKSSGSMNKLRMFWKVLGKAKYVIVIVIAVLVIGFFDNNSFIERYKHKQTISELKSEIAKYTDMHRRDSIQVKRLDHNPRYIEKIARERYFMKADDEDIFVLSDDVE